MDNIANQVKALAATADEKTYREIVDGLRELLYATERPEDTAHRLIFGHLQLAIAQVAQDTKLIEVLVKNERKPVPVGQIASETGISELLTERILRYMAAMGMAGQTSDHSFVATRNTEALDTPGVRAGTGIGMGVLAPSSQALPAFLKQNEYKSTSSLENCSWHPGHNKELNAFQFLFANPTIHNQFNTFMQYQRLNSQTWLDVYPLDTSAAPDRDLFVDIGGGMGHMCVALKQRYPEVTSGLVLQDVPHTISNLPPDQPFRAMVHDYHTEQPIKGAKYYYLRNAMHNMDDESSKKALNHIKEAMGPDSKILVDEVVVPAIGAHWRAVQLDMAMMAVLGAIERTEEQWHALFNSVGLKIANKYVYDNVQADTVIEVVRA